MIVLKLIVFLVSIIVGYFIISKRERLVFTFGHISWADRYLGGGGSYLFWIGVGTAIIVLSFAWLMRIF